MGKDPEKIGTGKKIVMNLNQKRILFKSPGTNGVTGSFLLLHLGRPFTDRKEELP